MPSTKAIRDALIEAREKRSWSQERLAERSGLTVRAITALETDSSISIRDLRLACRLLDLAEPEYPRAALEVVGNLVRDRRESAQISRREAARMARVSDATLKFLETAWQTPSRKTFLSLYAIPELKLTWQDFGNFGGLAPAGAAEHDASLVVGSDGASAPVKPQADDLGAKRAEKLETGPTKIQIDLRIVLEVPVELSDLVRQVVAGVAELALAR